MEAGERRGEGEGEGEGFPVLSEVRPLAPVSVRPSLGVQGAAVILSGFLAGAASAAALHRRRSRRGRGVRRLGQTSKPGRDRIRVVGSRSFLIDVRLLEGRD